MNTRNYGIDMLRVIAMLMIVMHHLLTHGGLLASIPPPLNCWQTAIYSPLGYIVGFGINCFALISGYVGFVQFNKSGCELFKRQISKFIKLWGQVLFYSVSLFAIFGVLLGDISVKSDFIKAILPISSKQYWYFSAYAGLIVLAPGLNIVVQYIQEYIGSDNRKSIFLIVLLLGCSLMWSDPFGFNDGYSLAWLIYLYIIGAFTKALEMTSKISIKLLSLTFSIVIIFMQILGHLISSGDILSNRTGPCVVIPPILLLIIFSKISFRNDAIKKLLEWLTPSIFAVYLLHDNRYFRQFFITDKFQFDSTGFVNPLITLIIATAVIFIIGILIDKFRLQLLSLLSTIIIKTKAFISLNN